MKKKILGLALGLFLWQGFAFGATYALDKTSHIGFKVKKFLVKNVKGEFKDFNGTLSLENGQVVALEGQISINSVFTGDEKRDKHLLEADFFDAQTFQTAHFVMKSYTELSRDKKGIKGQIVGELNLHGVRREVIFKSLLKLENQPKLRLKTELNIKDFNIQGSMMNSDNVDVFIKTLWNENP